VDVNVVGGVGKTKPYHRRFVELVGLRRSDVTYRVHNNSYINALRALIERVYFIENVTDGSVSLVPPPKPKRAHFFQSMQRFRSQLWQNLKPVWRMSLNEFVETSPQHKRKCYAAAMTQYLTKGMAPSQVKVKSFIKAEKISGKKADPCPRLIQPRGVVFNLLFGCFIRPAEKVIYRAIDRVFGRPTVVCGQNAEGIATMLRSAWDEIVDPIAISLDLSRFDQHISSVALKWEHSTYREIFKNDTARDTLEFMLNSTIKNRGVIYTQDKSGRPQTIQYSVNGARMSGDMNTSLGNKLIMCGLLYSYYIEHCGLVARQDVNVIDNGDDCVVILSHAAHEKCKTDESDGRIRGAVDWFREMGFTLKVEGVVDKFEHIEFCQTQPCFIDGRWIMVRRLDALSKDCYSLQPIDVIPRWMGQIRESGLTTYGSVPIYSQFYKCFPANAGANRELIYGTGTYYLSHNMTSTGVVTDANRVAFFDTFGVTPREQIAIEEHYASLTYTSNPDPNTPGAVMPLPII